MAFTLSRIDRINRTYDVTVTDANGTIPAPATAALALLPVGRTPTAATVWTPVTVVNGSTTVLFAGPDADPTDAIVVPGDCQLWLRSTALPEVDAEKVERINVLGAGSITGLPDPRVLSVNGHPGPAVTLTASDVGAQPAGSYATPSDVTTASTADRARANHTGTQPASTVTGLATVATSGSYADLTAKPTIPTVGAAGAGAAVALSSTDASVTNSRTPTTHAASHASGGSDPVTPAAIGADAAGAATAAQAFAIQRANHTGTQAATTITGLATVATSGLKADVGLGNVDNTSDANKPVSTAQQTALDAKATLDPNRLAVGESTLPRYILTGASLAAVSGQLKLTYFTAQTTETVANVRSFTGNIAAGATPTLCRIGIYSVAGNGDLSLVGSTANDTTLWAAANTAYTRALSVSFTKTAGQRYAIGQLIVTAATLPTWPGTTFNANSEWSSIAPRLSGVQTGQTDLSSSIPNASVNGNAQMFYLVVTP